MKVVEKVPIGRLLLTDFDGAWGEDPIDEPGIPVIRSTDMRGGKLVLQAAERRVITAAVLAKKRLVEGDILVTKSSGSAHLVGASVLFKGANGEDYVCSNFTRCLRPDPTMVIPEYLYFGLQSPLFKEQVFGAQRTTSGLRNLKIDEFKSGKLRLPALDEQRRIVDRIKDCLTCIEEIEENQESMRPELSAVFPSILNQLFKELYGRAELATLETVADIRGGQSLPAGISIDNGDKTVLLVKVGDMNAEGNDRTIATSRAFLPLSEVGRGLVPAGAVIFPKRGGAIATNKKRLLGRPSLLDPNLMAVVANPEVTRESYLYYWCQTLDLNELSNGGVIPQLNRKDLAPLEIPLPNLHTQDDIVAELETSESVCSELRRQFQATSEERNHLRDSILRKAFAGEL